MKFLSMASMSCPSRSSSHVLTTLRSFSHSMNSEMSCFFCASVAQLGEMISLYLPLSISISPALADFWLLNFSVMFVSAHSFFLCYAYLCENSKLSSYAKYVCTSDDLSLLTRSNISHQFVLHAKQKLCRPLAPPRKCCSQSSSTFPCSIWS